MKPFFRNAIVLLAILFYTGCQKEVSSNVPPGTQPLDSTSTGVDSTISNLPDTLSIISFSPDSGRVGTVVTIMGKGFDSIISGNRISINTTEATIISATNTILTVLVMEGTTTGKVSVTADRKSATSQTDFVVLKDSVVADTAATGSNAWVRKNDPPPTVDVFNNLGIAVGTKGYVYAGAMWEYNPVSDHWTQKATRPAGPGGFYPFAFAINNKIYVGSNTAQEPDSVTLWVYDIATDSWTRKKNLPIVPRLAAFGFAINNTGYVGGGQVDFDTMHTHDFWKYNAETDTWSRQADFPGKWTIGISGFVIEGKAYVFDAGLGWPQAPVAGGGTGTLWQYDPVNNKWTEKASCPVSTQIMAAIPFAIKNKGYVALSMLDRPDSPRDNFWMYDPDTNTWTKKPDVGGGPHWFGTGFGVGGKCYVGLGTGTTADDSAGDFWEYTPN